MFESLKTFKFFMSRRYLERVEQGSSEFEPNLIKDLVTFCWKYFPTYARAHWRTLRELKEDYKEGLPFAVHETDLPQDILGLFIPEEPVTKKAQILLNKANGQGMHLTTLAHETGHLCAYMYQKERHTDADHSPHVFRARGRDLIDSLGDSQELLADFMGAIGAYPRETFKREFCNKNGEVRWIYKSITPLLFLKSMLYVAKYYRELAGNFIRCNQRLFELCLTLHLARLRIYAYENFGV